jgi:heparan-alpha-glucosaminide N-acetyltransferase
MTKLSHFFFVLISALLLVALIIVSFYWTCKAVNKFYLSRSATNNSPDETLQPSDNELEMPKEKKRLKSLDIFRGVAIVLMIFVNSGGGHYWWIEHATWNGLHVADVVFPWFLFIMGVCIPMSLKSQVNRQIPKAEIAMKIVQVSKRDRKVTH